MPIGPSPLPISLTPDPLCLQCLSEHYFSETAYKCIQLKIPNCFLTNPTTGKCSQCQNGYLLSQNGCDKAPLVQNCVEYSNSVPGQCTKCRPNDFKFERKSCLPVEDTLSQCLQYDNLGKCTLCADRYVLPDCLPILLTTNCLKSKVGEAECLQCSKYSLLFKRNCYFKQEIGVDYCALGNIDNTSFPLKCEMCDNNAEIVNVEPHHSMCKVEKFMEIFYGKCQTIRVKANSKQIASYL